MNTYWQEAAFEKHGLGANVAVDFRGQFLGPMVREAPYSWRSAGTLLWLPWSLKSRRSSRRRTRGESLDYQRIMGLKEREWPQVKSQQSHPVRSEFVLFFLS